MGVLDPVDTAVLQPEDLQKEEIKPVEASTSEKGDELPAFDKLSCGYVVGLDPTGELVFEILGSQPGLVQLLGLHSYAGHRLEIASDINLNYGIPILAKQLAEIQKALGTLLNMQTQQAKTFMGSLIKK